VRIGIDARAASEEPGGRGRYVRELLRALAARDDDHEYVLYARTEWEPRGALGPRFAWVLHGLPDPAWHLATALRCGSCDVLLSTNSYLTAWAARAPTALTIFDLVAFDDALSPRRRSRAIERATLPLAVRRAAGFAAISASARDDLEARFPRARGRVAVTPLAADPRFAPDPPGGAAIRARHGLDGPYLLSVGTLEPRKNLPRLVAAFAALPPATRGEHVLAVVGASGWDTAATEAALGANAGAIRRLGHVPDEDLPALYAGATALCYPSLYEGFGLPVLEAMACGTAVLTSDRSSLPEVAGDAALLVDPRDEGAIAAGLARLLTDGALRERLAAAGPPRAAGFSWDRTAAGTLALLEGVARG